MAANDGRVTLSVLLLNEILSILSKLYVVLKRENVEDRKRQRGAGPTL